MKCAKFWLLRKRCTAIV